IRPGLARPHGDAGLHHSQRRRRVAPDMALVRQCVDERLRQDQDVAGRARQQLVAHGTDRAERARYLHAVRLPDGIAKPADQALCRATRKQLKRCSHAGSHSALMLAALITPAHFTMSSWMYLSNCAGVMTMAVAPCRDHCCCTSGWLVIFDTASFSL